MATGVKVESLGNDLRSKTRHYRGHEYIITELPFVDYNKVRKDAGWNTFDDDGKSQFDSDAQTAMLLAKCVRVDGEKKAVDWLYERGTGLVTSLIADINSVLYDDEVEDAPADTDADDGAGEATKSSSATGSSPA